MATNFMSEIKDLGAGVVRVGGEVFLSARTSTANTETVTLYKAIDGAETLGKRGEAWQSIGDPTPATEDEYTHKLVNVGKMWTPVVFDDEPTFASTYKRETPTA